jgi:glutathione peroxidase
MSPASAVTRRSTTGLQKIYEQYKDRGFTILGFPANNFGAQEPGSNEEIQEFCRINYGVTFPIFSKISVKGDDIHPLYKYLTEKETNPEFGGEIKWNFNKFLVGKTGRSSPASTRRTSPKMRR